MPNFRSFLRLKYLWPTVASASLGYALYNRNYQNKNAQKTILNAFKTFSTISSPTLAHTAATSDREKIQAFIEASVPRKSLGIIMDMNTFEAEKHRFPGFEFVPAFKSLAEIRNSLLETGEPGPQYEALDTVRKQWLSIYLADSFEQYKGYFTERQVWIALPRKFKWTPATYIAVELLHDIDYNNNEIIQKCCMRQLCRATQYAHEQDDRKIILVNHTKFTQEQLLEKIKEQMPTKERKYLESMLWWTTITETLLKSDTGKISLHI